MRGAYLYSIRKLKGTAIGETKVLVKQDNVDVLLVVLDREGEYQRYYAITSLGLIEVFLGKVSVETTSALSKAVQVGLDRDISLGSTLTYDREEIHSYER